MTVRECIRKLGEHSQFICQLRAYVRKEKGNFYGIYRTEIQSLMNRILFNSEHVKEL